MRKWFWLMLAFLCVVQGRAASLGAWSLNEDGREVRLAFDAPLAETATNGASWSVAGGGTLRVVGARLFAGNTCVGLRLSAPLDTRSTYTFSGTVTARASGEACAVTVAVKRPKPVALPARLLQGNVETPTASSRRSPVGVSEVHAAPAPRADGRDLRFVELFNSNPYPARIGGYALSGAVVYTFPSGTALAARSCVVVAANAADVRAVYGIDNVVQADDAASLAWPCAFTLKDEQGAVLGDFEADDDVPWPAGIAESGHSLVLARPSYGWTNPDGWSRSALPGGSPGCLEPARPTGYEGLLINEVLPHGGPDEGYIELYSTRDEAAALAGCTLEVAGTTNVYVIPPKTPIAAHRTWAVGETALGFAIGGQGVELLLRAPAEAGGFLIDALRVPPTELGRAYGRYPDGSPLASRLAAPTPNERNLARAGSDLVLNELMYHPITETKKDEYLEIRNLAASNRALKGWCIKGSVEYDFTKKDFIDAEGYLVVPRTREAFTNLYPSVTQLSSKTYSGALPNGRGVVRLCRECEVWSAKKGEIKTKDVPMDEVVYRDGGVWGTWSDGGGSSLERVDPRADGRLAGSWADSDETQTCGWKTIAFTGTIELGTGTQNAVELGLADAGECLVEDVELKAGSGANAVLNPSFESGAAGWSFQGTHRLSAVEACATESGAKVLHLRATDKMHNGGNCVRGRTSDSVATSGTGTISARVRWLCGSPDFLVKSRGNWLEASGSILTTTAMGTPGRANSRAETAAPTIAEMTHLPILPKANAAATVWARADGGEGVLGLDLLWAKDGATATNRVAMTRADGGWWHGEIPGQTAGTLVAFRVVASGAGATTVTAQAPREGCAHVRFGEAASEGALASYRIWIGAGDVKAWKNQVVDSNETHPCTFVYGDARAIYGAGAEYGGSSWHAANAFTGTPGDAGGIYDYKITLPKDEPVHDDDGLVLAMPGNGGDDSTGVREQFVYSLLRKNGEPWMNRNFVHVYFNGVRQNRLGLHEDTEKPGGDVLDHWFPGGGRAYKMCCWCEYPTNYPATSSYVNDQGVKLADTQYKATDGTYPTRRLRWNFQPRGADNFEADDYDGIRELLAAVNARSALSDEELDAVLDAKSYAQVLAIERYVMNSDSYGMPTDLNSGHSKGKNMYICRGAKGWQLVVWDIDISFGFSSTTTYALSAYDKALDPQVPKLLARPLFQRYYWQALKGCVEASAAGAPELEAARAAYNALVADGASLSGFASLASKIESRRAYTAAQVAARDAAAFTVTSPADSTASVTTNQVDFAGTAPFSVETIEVNGDAVPVTWTSPTNWTYSLALTSTVTTVTVTARAADGTTVGDVSRDYTVTGPVLAGAAPPAPAAQATVAEGDTVILAEGFEKATVGASVTNGLGFRAEGGGVPIGADEEGSVIRAHAPAAPVVACGEPDVFQDLSNTRYLHYHTEAGEGRIWRSAGPVAGAADGALFVDVLVQLDLWEVGGLSLADMAPDQRFQFWVEADNAAGVTNLCIAALRYDDDGWETTVETNVFRRAVVADFSSNAWHRLTLKLIDDVTRAHERNPEWYPEGVQGFQVWFDGEPVQMEGESSFTDAYVEFLAFEDDPTWGWLTAGDPVDETVAAFLQSGTVFADLRGAGSGGLSDVGFKGTGGADDVTVTTGEPAGMRSATFDAVLLSETDAAFAGASVVRLDAWLAAIGRTAREATGDARAAASYLLGIDLGLEEDPEMTITRLEPAGEDQWDVTVTVSVRGAGESTAQPVELQNGAQTTFNGTLLVQTSATLGDLETVPAQAYPLVFEADRTELTVRVAAEAGHFFRAKISARAP